MYKPSDIRKFVTSATHYHIEDTVINGRTSKTKVLSHNPNIKGAFKLKGTSEINANGLTVINDKTTYFTWWKNDFRSSDILTIGGIDYSIIGTPENVELRGRYCILNLEKIEGDA